MQSSKYFFFFSVTNIVHYIALQSESPLCTESASQQKCSTLQKMIPHVKSYTTCKNSEQSYITSKNSAQSDITCKKWCQGKKMCKNVLRMVQFSEKIDKKYFGPNFFDPSQYQAQTFSNHVTWSLRISVLLQTVFFKPQILHILDFFGCQSKLIFWIEMCQID